MQFADLDGLTPLPVEHIEHRFRNEEVITVLPLRGSAGQPSLVVATPFILAKICSGTNELVNQVAFRTHNLYTVITGLFCQ